MRQIQSQTARAKSDDSRGIAKAKGGDTDDRAASRGGDTADVGGRDATDEGVVDASGVKKSRNA